MLATKLLKQESISKKIDLALKLLKPKSFCREGVYWHYPDKDDSLVTLYSNGLSASFTVNGKLKKVPLKEFNELIFYSHLTDFDMQNILNLLDSLIETIIFIPDR